MIKKFLLLAFITSLSISASAQWAKLKFGNISFEELKMDVYPKDSTAPAVVLYDYGELDLKEFKYRRYTRIKILTKEGYDWGNTVFPIFDGERVSSFKAATYNLENGKMVTSTLNEEGKFKEEFIEGIDVIRWAMPNVREGSVLEYKYEIEGGGIRDWEFQKRIPVRHSEFKLIGEGEMVRLQMFMQGYMSPTTIEEKHWAMQDVPAFIDEPHISSFQNYVSKLNLELASIQLSLRNTRSTSGYGYYYNDYNLINDWADISKQFNSAIAPGKPVNGAGFLSEATKEVIKNCKNPDEKVKAIHAYVQSLMQWNGRYDKGIRKRGLKKVFEEKIGISGEINWIMFSMMRLAGLPADPVLISTRENGFIRMEVPNRNGFDHMIVMTDYNGEKKLIDATDKFLSMDYLPESCLNGFGYWVKVTGFEWVPLTNKNKIRTIYNVDVKLNQEGTVQGTLVINKNGCAASNTRKRLSTEEVTYKKEIFTGTDFQITETKTENFSNLSETFKEQYTFTLTDYAQTTSEGIYINPILFSRMSQNPFPAANRIYPIEFEYPHEIVFTARIAIPEGYAVEETPGPKMALLPEGGGRFIYNVNVQQETITIVNQFSLNKNMFAQTEYPDVREFYNVIAAKHAEQIVLKKK